ncbi:MAG TPA: DUF2946 domain-containing protein [Paraburkholderia sp.]|uniref:DUF2946 domain-containing protein n=1 Tax=Paraburkholderia sp. TaxID=1926495 RepID=UPI002D06D553|nr:DUF2946 domain-containing protein [Paraburkholderia sp.]HTR08598.1 DUF2946 domain-containing protein [Paraburkholderia sp.]
MTTTWLGLIAMWLLVLAPLVSQLIVAHRAFDPDTVWCSATSPGQSDHTATHEGVLSACGYCDLLATYATLPPLPAVILPLLALVIVAVLPALQTRFTALGAFPSGRPRAPPHSL